MSFNLFGGNKNTNKRTKTVQKVKLGTTTTTNPFVNSTTTNKGTTSEFISGSAFDTINNFVNANMGSLLYNYLNPSLDSPVNQSLMNSYVNSLTKGATALFENGVVNPLSQRNMMRSSQATNLYNSFASGLNSQVDSYAQDLLSKTQQNSADMINNLLGAYMKGVGVLNTNQAQSLQTSVANATKTTKGSSVSGSGSDSDEMMETIIKILPYIIMAFA